jgi:hypothetical protein
MSTLVLALALLFLQAPQSSIEGVVLNRVSGQPIAGARVSVYRLTPPRPHCTPSSRTTADDSCLRGSMPENTAFTRISRGTRSKEASFGTVDLRVERLRVTEGPQSPVLLEIGTNGGSRDGSAAVGARIALVPADRVRRDLYRFATAGADGKYLLRGIVPGDYKLFVFGRDTEPYAAFDPAFLQTQEQNGIAVVMGSRP